MQRAVTIPSVLNLFTPSEPQLKYLVCLMLTSALMVTFNSEIFSTSVSASQISPLFLRTLKRQLKSNQKGV